VAIIEALPIASTVLNFLDNEILTSIQGFDQSLLKMIASLLLGVGSVPSIHLRSLHALLTVLAPLNKVLGFRMTASLGSRLAERSRAIAESW
jgi:hypothetical protein